MELQFFHNFNDVNDLNNTFEINFFLISNEIGIIPLNTVCLLSSY